MVAEDTSLKKIAVLISSKPQQALTLDTSLQWVSRKVLSQLGINPTFLTCSNYWGTVNENVVK